MPIPLAGHPTRVEQRWFVGDHGNVGGGGTTAPATDNPLSLLSREWIVDRAVEAGLVVGPPPTPLTGSEWSGPIHDFYRSVLGRLARLLPGIRPSLRPGNPYLEPWTGRAPDVGPPPSPSAVTRSGGADRHAHRGAGTRGGGTAGRADGTLGGDGDPPSGTSRSR